MFLLIYCYLYFKQLWRIILCLLKNFTRKIKTKNLVKIPASYESRFYKTLDDPFDKPFDTYFQRDVISKAPSDVVKDYLLATSDFGKRMQDDINMYVTRYRLNNASFRQKLDPIAKTYLGDKIKILILLMHKIQ